MGKNKIHQDQQELEDEKKERKNITNRGKSKNKINRPEDVYQVGTFSAIVVLCKKLFKNRFSMDHLEAPSKKGVIAIILTIIVVIIIGIILWFIPFTNGWMRELLFENPLFNWIGSIFS